MTRAGKSTHPPVEIVSRDEHLIITYSGASADSHSLHLTDYARSLAGLREILNLLTGMVLHSQSQTSYRNVEEFIRFEVRAERPGSYELVIRLAEGVAGNAIWQALAHAGGWTVVKLIKWIGGAINTHIDTKRDTPDVDMLVAALEKLAAESKVPLEPVPPVEQPKSDIFQNLLGLIESTDHFGYDLEEEDIAADAATSVSRRRLLVDRLDNSLKEFARPLGSSCEKITISSTSAGEVVKLDLDTKAVIEMPLTLLPKEQHWRKAEIKFVRINRKTGRSLMYFANDPAGEDNTHYSVIVDHAIRRASNVYTEAFNKDAPLTVYVRHAPAERGRIRTMWQITALEPQSGFFGWP